MSRKDLAALQRICVPHRIATGDILHVAGAALPYVYFPVSGFVSMLSVVRGSPAIEAGMVGREGMVGAELALGDGRASMQALVQGDGIAMRATAAAFRRELAAAPGLRRCIGRYLSVRMQQLAGIAPCLRFHVIEARLARWLLMSHDRSESSTFQVKQEFLAWMLGVRRVGVSAAAKSLHAQGLIRYSRGTLEVLDRAGLEAVACACYEADSVSYSNEFGAPPPGAQAPA